MVSLWGLLIITGVGLIVWGAETFAEHLGPAAVRLRVSTLALALLLAGAEPEELATAVTASLRDLPAVAIGDVVGANIAICLVALGVGAWIAPLPFNTRVRRYGLLGLPLGLAAGACLWDGQVGRPEGLLLVGLYILFVVVIGWAEHQVPALGETGEIQEALETSRLSPLGPNLLWVLAGLAAMVSGSVLLVESVRQISAGEGFQLQLSLTLVGFATAFELVVLAWSTARRGASEAAVAGVVGSFAYNVTMTLGMAALVRPLRVAEPGRLHLPLAAMEIALGLALLLALPRGRLDRRAGGILLITYPVLMVILTSNLKLMP